MLKQCFAAFIFQKKKRKEKKKALSQKQGVVRDLSETVHRKKKTDAKK